MPFVRRPIEIRLEDMRGKGPQVVCLERLPTAKGCTATQFFASRTLLGRTMFDWFEQEVDGCGHHVMTLSRPKPLPGVEVVLSTFGRFSAVIDGASYQIPKGSYVVINLKGTREVGDLGERAVKFHVFQMREEWWMKFLREEGGLRGSEAARLKFEGGVRKADEHWIGAFKLIQRGFREGVQSGSPLLVDTAALQLAVLLFQSHPHSLKGHMEVEDRTRQDARVRRALEFLRDNYVHTVGLDEMAASAGLSRSQLVRLFKAQVGQSPYQYLMKYRVGQSVKVMQSSPHLPLKEVSERVGIPNVRHFCRLVLQVTGKKPSQIRGR